MLRVQTERLAGLDLIEEYKSNYQLTEDLLTTHAPEALILHPGPIIRGLELTSAVADGANSCVLEQVHNGLPIRMALVEAPLRRSMPLRCLCFRWQCTQQSTAAGRLA